MAMCANCGATNPPTLDHCVGCGAALVSLAGGYASGTIPRAAPDRPGTKRDLLLTAAAGRLFGLRVRDGSMVWWNQLAQPAEAIFEVQLCDEHVLALTSAGLLFCIDYPTGRTRWTYPTAPGHHSALRAVAGLVFVAHGSTLDCLNTHGYRLWTQSVPGIGTPTMVLRLPTPHG